MDLLCEELPGGGGGGLWSGRRTGGTTLEVDGLIKKKNQEKLALLVADLVRHNSNSDTNTNRIREMG